MKHAFIFFSIVLLLSCNKNVHLEESFNQKKPNTDWAFPHFEKVDGINPFLNPSSDFDFIDPMTKTPIKWEERNVLNPTAMVKNDSIYLLYRAQDLDGTFRIGLAVSSDKDYEKVGEVNEVCFVEGLVYFKNKWFYTMELLIPKLLLQYLTVLNDNYIFQ